MAKSAKRPGKIRLFILAVLVWGATFAAIEMLARWMIWDERDFRVCDRDTHHALLPNVRSQHRWGRRVVPYFTNSLGLRDREPRRVAAQQLGGRRILFLGDSFAEGLGVAFEHTFVGLLSSRYTDTGVFTGGVMSYSPFLEHRQLLRIGKTLRPSIVVVLVDSGDVQDEIIHRAEARADFGPPPSFRCIGWWETLKRLRVVRLANDLRHRLVGLWAPRPVALWTEQDRAAHRTTWLSSGEAYADWGRRGLDLLFESLLQIDRYCRANHCKVAVVIFPDGTILRNRTAQLFDYQRRVAEFARAHQIPLLNLFDVFGAVDNAQSLFIPGDWHWNEEGHRLVADLMYDFLARIR